MTNRHSRNSLLRFALSFGTVLMGMAPSVAYGQGFVSMWDYGLQGYGALTPLEGVFTQVTAGDEFSLALRADGSIKAWGSDHESQISSAPSGTGFTQISAGTTFGVALRSNGSLVAWGERPLGTPGASNFTQVAAGFKHSVALDVNGSITAWGDDQYGQVTNAPTGAGYLLIASGLSHSMALRSDGSIDSWGLDWFGQVSSTPAGTGFVQLEGGGLHSLALRSDGSIVAWGSDSDGQVSAAPTGTGYLQVAANGSTSLALRSDGTIEMWGAPMINSQPPFLPTGTGYVKIAAGGSHTLAIKPMNTGVPYCIGGYSINGCPCTGPLQGDGGCPNSAGMNGAKLTGSGNGVISADTFQLTVSRAPVNSFGLVLVASDFNNGALGLPFGDGLGCVGGQISNSQVQVTSAGTGVFSDFRGSPFGSANYGIGLRTHYQYWYRDPAGPCSGAGFNVSNAWTVTWR